MNYKHHIYKIYSTLFIVISTSCIALEILAQPEELTSSSEIGLLASYYQYGEPDVMNLRGGNGGVDYLGTWALNRSWFLRGDIILMVGKAKYDSYKTGSINGETNSYLDTRALCGRHLTFGESSVAPFVGLGYRYLYNDSRGISSNGANGYRRESNYLYAPIGLIHTMNLSEQSRLVTTIEFDSLLLGKQLSRTSDAGISYKDFTNTQKSGYGSRLSLMYQLDNWSIGPYLIYWHINNSDTVAAPGLRDCRSGDIGCNKSGKIFDPALLMFEPQNYTLEAGLKVSYKF